MADTTKRKLKTWGDAHVCDACKLLGAVPFNPSMPLTPRSPGTKTLATHGTTDMVEVASGVFKESPRMRYGCAKHPVVAQRIYIDGTSVPWKEEAALCA